MPFRLEDYLELVNWTGRILREDKRGAKTTPGPRLPQDSHSQQIFRLRLGNYLELVDSTGRIVRKDKRGAIDDRLAPILDRLGIDAGEWLENVTQFEALYYRRFSLQRRQNAVGFG